MVKCECIKCGGTGHIKQFSNVHGGVCYTCGGTGYVMLKAPRKESNKKTIKPEDRIHPIFINIVEVEEGEILINKGTRSILDAKRFN